MTVEIIENNIAFIIKDIEALPDMAEKDKIRICRKIEFIKEEIRIYQLSSKMDIIQDRFNDPDESNKKGE